MTVALEAPASACAGAHSAQPEDDLLRCLRNWLRNCKIERRLMTDCHHIVMLDADLPGRPRPLHEGEGNVHDVECTEDQLVVLGQPDRHVDVKVLAALVREAARH